MTAILVNNERRINVNREKIFDDFLDSNEADKIFSAVQTAIKEAFLKGFEVGSSSCCKEA